MAEESPTPSSGSGCSLPVRISLRILRAYQKLLSPLLPPSCRFHPTCSNYAIEALSRHGLFWGSWLASRRLLRCHPFHPGGYDPVPERLRRGFDKAEAGPGPAKEAEGGRGPAEAAGFSAQAQAGQAFKARVPGGVKEMAGIFEGQGAQADFATIRDSEEEL